MKMRAEHYATLAAAMTARPLEWNPLWSEKRNRWDAFLYARVCGNTTSWICAALYPYLDDTHIDTALRTYFRERIKPPATPELKRSRNARKAA